MNKGFNKPGEYAAVLDRLAQRNVYAITSFIFGMDNDTTGVAERTLEQIRTWPAGLPIFGLLTPLPATPLYKRLETAGRLTRPKHWQEFIPFAMAHTPLKMTIRRSPRRGEVRLGSVIQPGGNREGRGFARPQASRLPHQHTHRAPLLPRDLFPPDGQARVGENNPSKPRDNLEAHQGRLQRSSGSVAGHPSRDIKQSQRLGLTRARYRTFKIGESRNPML